jgi:hypothetical protein
MAKWLAKEYNRIKIEFHARSKQSEVVCTFIGRKHNKTSLMNTSVLKTQLSKFTWQNETAHHENLTNNSDIIHGR